MQWVYSLRLYGSIKQVIIKESSKIIQILAISRGTRLKGGTYQGMLSVLSVESEREMKSYLMGVNFTVLRYPV